MTLAIVILLLINFLLVLAIIWIEIKAPLGINKDFNTQDTEDINKDLRFLVYPVAQHEETSGRQLPLRDAKGRFIKL